LIFSRSPGVRATVSRCQSPGVRATVSRCLSRCQSSRDFLLPEVAQSSGVRATYWSNVLIIPALGRSILRCQSNERIIPVLEYDLGHLWCQRNKMASKFSNLANDLCPVCGQMLVLGSLQNPWCQRHWLINVIFLLYRGLEDSD